MGRKQKYTVEQKVKACEDYLSNKKSAIMIARELSMGKYGRRKIYEWVYAYKINGSQIFEYKPKNTSYSKEFKES